MFLTRGWSRLDFFPSNPEYGVARRFSHCSFRTEASWQRKIPRNVKVFNSSSKIYPTAHTTRDAERGDLRPRIYSVATWSVASFPCSIFLPPFSARIRTPHRSLCHKLPQIYRRLGVRTTRPRRIDDPSSRNDAIRPAVFRRNKRTRRVPRESPLRPPNPGRARASV